MKTLTAKQLARKTGFTYRQIDYWTTEGVLPTTNPERRMGKGGEHRLYDAQLVPKLQRITELSEAFKSPHGGGFPLKYAKEILEHWDRGWINIGDSFTLRWVP